MSENFKPKSSEWVMNHFGITRGKLAKYDELISPDTRSDQQYNQNKYREYRYEDIEKMWYIHMLSQMGMQMKEIKELINQDELTFREAIIQRIEDLENEKRKIEGMISIAQMCRVTGRIPLPKDFATVPFADYREAVLQKWSSTQSDESNLMMALADYRVEATQSECDEDGQELLLPELSEGSQQVMSKLDIIAVIEMAAIEQQLARLFPTDISSEEVIDTVKRYCVCIQKMLDDDDYPLNKVADHLSSQFFDGDGSVELIRRYGKKRQEYIASAFKYFAQNA